jgi:hypothetical protein
MSDDLPPQVTDITEATPRRRGRLTVMPSLPGISPQERRDLMNFMKAELESIARSYQEREDLIKSGGEHPMPLYAKLVHKHAAMGQTVPQICRYLGISRPVLERWYADELELGVAQINLRIASNVARKALSDDPDAAKIGLDWLDRRGGDGWRKSTQKIDVSTEEKAPLLDLTRTTYDERQALRAILMRAAARAEQGEDGEELRPDEINGA